MKILLRKMMQI